MAELATALFQDIWDGLMGLQVFDLGFSFGIMFLGTMFVLLSIRVFKNLFQFSSAIGTGIGKNARSQIIAKSKKGDKS